MTNTNKSTNVIRTKKNMTKKSTKILKPGYIVNPFTSRPVKKSGNVYKKIKTDIDEVNKFNANLKREFLKEDIKELKEKVKKEGIRKHKMIQEREKYLDKRTSKHLIGQTENVVVTIIFYTRNEFGAKKYVTLNGDKFSQINIFDVTLDRLDNNYLNKYIIRPAEERIPSIKILTSPEIDDNYESPFTHMIRRLLKYSSDDDFKNKYMITNQSNNIDCIYIMNSRELKRPPGEKRLTLPRLFKRNKINDARDNNIILNKYVKYNLNKDAKTFSELFDINTSLCSYVQENYKANSCFINVIINTYYNEFEKLHSNGTRLYKQPLTYPYLCALLDVQNVHQDLGITVCESYKFFEKFGLGLDILNNQNECILKYRPLKRKLNDHIKPAVLRILLHNNHCIKIDKCNDAKISHIDVSETSNIIKSLWITNKYNIIDYNIKMTKDVSEDKTEDEKEKDDNYMLEYVNNINDMFLIIKDNEDKQKYKFIYNDINLNNLLYDITTKHKITPQVRMMGHIVISIYIELDEIKYVIVPRTDINEGAENENAKATPFDIEEYEEYQEEDKLFYTNIFNSKHISQYPDDIRTIDNYYNLSPQMGYFTENKQDTSILNGVDIRKAYTDAMRNISEIPVFGQFNRYRKYIHNENIDPLKIYIIKINNIDDWSNILLFHKKIDRVYGSVLLEAQKQDIKFNIIYVRDYERLEKVEYKKYIDKLYSNTKLSIESKKMIVNKTTGLLETKRNKRQMSYIYNNYSEAEMYKYRYVNEGLSAKITPITSIVNEEQKSKLYDTSIIKETEKTIYILTVYRERELIDGFRQIKELIYCMHRIKMSELNKMCINAGLNVYGIKTDCLLLNNTEKEIRKMTLDFDTDIIGGYKIELLKTCNNKCLCSNESRKNSLIKNIVRETNNINIIDEYDTKEINEQLSLYNRLLIKSSIPGSGKSQIVKNYKSDDNKILFITPTNELALDLKKNGYDSMTVYAFLGMNHKEESINTSKDVYINNYNIVCFEEIYQYKRSILYRIDRYISEHKDTKFLSTGDYLQNKAIDNDNDDKKDIKYEDIINICFNNQITLKISKRLTNENDRQKIEQIKKDIFNINIDVTTTIKKYFKTVTKYNDVITEQNITYSNKTATNVSEHIHNIKKYDTNKIVIDQKTYYENMELVCRKAIRSDKLTLHTNYIYLLKSIKNKIIKLFEPVDNIYIEISISQFKESMRMNYARTGHSIQGRTMDNDITIFDADSPYTNRRWIWTALTRARKLENVQFYLMNEELKDILYECKIKQHFTIMIDKMNKTSEKKYMIDDVYELIDNNTNCKMCNCLYFADVEDGEIKTNTNIQIVDNNLNICCMKCRI